jgi:hypothetical protein
MGLQPAPPRNPWAFMYDTAEKLKRAVAPGCGRPTSTCRCTFWVPVVFSVSHPQQAVLTTSGGQGEKANCTSVCYLEVREIFLGQLCTASSSTHSCHCRASGARARTRIGPNTCLGCGGAPALLDAQNAGFGVGANHLGEDETRQLALAGDTIEPAFAGRFRAPSLTEEEPRMVAEKDAQRKDNDNHLYGFVFTFHGAGLLATATGKPDSRSVPRVNGAAPTKYSIQHAAMHHTHARQTNHSMV